MLAAMTNLATLARIARAELLRRLGRRGCDRGLLRQEQAVRRTVPAALLVSTRQDS